MSNSEENTDNVPILVNRASNNNERIPMLTNTPYLRDYFQQNEDNREFNVGYIDAIKSPGNVRMLSLNPHGFRPSDQRKVIMMQQAINRLAIDIVLLQEINTKWTSKNISQVERNMKAIDRESVVLTSDSKE